MRRAGGREECWLYSLVAESPSVTHTLSHGKKLGGCDGACRVRDDLVGLDYRPTCYSGKVGNPKFRCKEFHLR